MKETITTLTIVTLITGLAVYAISKGINGVLLGSVFTILGGLAGYQVTKQIQAKKKGKGNS